MDSGMRFAAELCERRAKSWKETAEACRKHGSGTAESYAIMAAEAAECAAAIRQAADGDAHQRILDRTAGDAWPDEAVSALVDMLSIPFKGCAECDGRGRPVPGSAEADANATRVLYAPLYERARAAIAKARGVAS